MFPSSVTKEYGEFKIIKVMSEDIYFFAPRLTFSLVLLLPPLDSVGSVSIVADHGLVS